MRKFWADDEADDDLETCLAVVDWSTGRLRSMASETKMSHRLPCKLSGRLRGDHEPSIMALAVKVKAKLPDTVVVRITPRHSSASNAERAIRTSGEQLRTLRHDTQNREKNARYAKLCSLAMVV